MDDKRNETFIKPHNAVFRRGKRRSKSVKVLEEAKVDDKRNETFIKPRYGVSRGGKRRSKSFNCPDCHSTFGSSDKVKKHKEIQHVSQINLFKCQKCEVNFVNQKALNFHSENQQLCMVAKNDCVINSTSSSTSSPPAKISKSNIETDSLETKDTTNYNSENDKMKIVPDNKWLTRNSKELGKILENLPTNTFLLNDDNDKLPDDEVEMESLYTDEVNSEEIEKSINSLLIPSNTKDKTMTDASTLTDEDEVVDWSEIDRRVNSMLILREFKDKSTNTSNNTETNEVGTSTTYTETSKINSKTNTDDSSPSFKELEEKIKKLMEYNKALRDIKNEKNLMIEKLQEKIDVLVAKKDDTQESKHSSLVSDLITENEHKDMEIRKLKIQVAEKDELIQKEIKNNHKNSSNDKQVSRETNDIDVVELTPVVTSNALVDGDAETEEKNQSEEKMETDELLDLQDLHNLVKYKNTGYRRSNPQGNPVVVKSFKCNLCDKTYNSKTLMEQHRETRHVEEGDWLCDDCDYQTNTISGLKKHIAENTGVESAHKSHLLEHKQAEFKCRFCDIVFTSENDKVKHRKVNHKTFRPCINFLSNTCEYDSECHFLHFKFHDGEHVCFQCGETFKGKFNLMNHIKTIHGDTPCKKFAKNQCKFEDDTCLYKHVKDDTNSSTNPVSRHRQKPVQDFQVPPRDLKPPDWPKLNLQKKKMKEMIPEMLTEMMPQMMTELIPQLLSQIMKTLAI